VRYGLGCLSTALRFCLAPWGLVRPIAQKGACTAARDIRWRTRGPTGPRGTNSSRASAGCRDSLDLEKGEATPITQLTTRKFIAVRLVRVGAWAMESCAIVAVEENDRVVVLKVAEQAERRECVGRNPEHRRQPARTH
jgi:hypothetical protein